MFRVRSLVVAAGIKAFIVAGSLILPAMAQVPSGIRTTLGKKCLGCHSGVSPYFGLNLDVLSVALSNRITRERWVLIHDRIEKGEKPTPGPEFGAVNGA